MGSVRASEYALRAAGEDDGLDDLAKSIARVGVLVPLLVVPDGGEFVVVAGHRRLEAAKRAGRASVPCMVSEDEEGGACEWAMAENVFRKDLSPVELASAIQDVLEKRVMDIDEVGAAMNRSRIWVVAQVNLLSWPPDVLGAIQVGELSVAAGHNLALITDEGYRTFLLRHAAENGATARITAAWLQAWRASCPPEVAVEAAPVGPGSQAEPATPQAPCICCGTVTRMDGLSMVMICCACISTIRAANAG